MFAACVLSTAQAQPTAAPMASTAATTAAATAAATAGTANLACPGAAAAVVERFISAECADCWASGAPALPGARAWTLDWITPTPLGHDAALAAAALLESAERALRAEQAKQGKLAKQTKRAGSPSGSAGAMGQPPAQQAGTRIWTMPPNPKSMRLSVRSGPAWHGYFGLSVKVQQRRGRWPAGSTAWVALVEDLPAGSEGNAQPRQLVRSVAGPLSLQAVRPGQPLTHWQAMRWPEGAKPERLRARAWIEAADGAILGMAADRCGR